MATKAASKRLAKESQMMNRDPPPYCYARPREENVLEWHFILRGPPDTPFYGGEYWGQLTFPSEYPFKPPGIKVSTPSGRFHTDTKICTSMSDFHPGSWNPAWSVANILVGLLSFMCSDEMTTGSVMASEADRQILAKRSHAFNITQARFKRIFPDFCTQEVKDLPNMGEIKAGQSSKSGGTEATRKATSPDPLRSNPPFLRQPTINASSMQTAAAAASGSTSTTSASRNQVVAGGVRPAADQSRSRTIFPILAALAAYLFLSRLFSILGSGTSGGGGGGGVGEL